MQDESLKPRPLRAANQLRAASVLKLGEVTEGKTRGNWRLSRAPGSTLPALPIPDVGLDHSLNLLFSPVIQALEERLHHGLIESRLLFRVR